MIRLILSLITRRKPRLGAVIVDPIAFQAALDRAFSTIPNPQKG